MIPRPRNAVSGVVSSLPRSRLFRAICRSITLPCTVLVVVVVLRLPPSIPLVPLASRCVPRSVSCPRLPRMAFVAEDLDARLDAAMTEFVRDHVVYTGGGTAQLSKIFDWFEDDFLDYERGAGNANPDLLDYVNRFRAPDAQIPGDTRVRFLNYDKGINAQQR